MWQDRFTLHYNELKEMVLRALSPAPMDSLMLFEELTRQGGGRLEIHAVRMALVRYYKQGLLTRERKRGVFSYGLSERGRRRLEWLQSLHYAMTDQSERE
jgi:hypothetical protein